MGKAGYYCTACKTATSLRDAQWTGFAPPPTFDFHLKRSYPAESRSEAETLARALDASYRAAGWERGGPFPEGIWWNGALDVEYVAIPDMVQKTRHESVSEVLGWVVVSVFVVAVVGALALFWWTNWGPGSPHYGQTFTCTKMGWVYIDKFNGDEWDCVEGYWSP